MRAFLRDGVWESIRHHIVVLLREGAGREASPTAAVVDTQSVRTGPQRGPRGYDAGKKVKGRKRVVMVDTEGAPLGIRVVPADAHDHRALLALASDLALHPTLLLIWLDRGFAGDEPRAFLNGRGITVEIVGIRERRDQGASGLPGRAEALEGGADVRLPAALPAAPGRRRDELRELARHGHARGAVHDRHAPRAAHRLMTEMSDRLLASGTGWPASAG